MLTGHRETKTTLNPRHDGRGPASKRQPLHSRRQADDDLGVTKYYR